MKTMAWKILLFAALVPLAGCAGGPPRNASIPAGPGDREVLVWSSSPQRPAWTLEEPQTVNGMLSFVGVSNRHATERASREDARRNATSAAVRYMGTLVKDKFERATASFGLESSVVDATTSAREFEKQLATHMARRVKVKTWYEEKWKTPTGIGYQTFALATVQTGAAEQSAREAAQDLVRKAEQQTREASDARASAQAEKATEFWKKMQERGFIDP